jgi:hypothetical protein
MLEEQAERWNGKHERSDGLHKPKARKTAGNPLRRAMGLAP